MFDDELDDKVLVAIDWHNGKIFEQFGTVVFPTKNKVLKVENKDTSISMFVEKRFVGGFFHVVTNFVFLYGFKGVEDSGGATVAFSMLDENKAKLFDNTNEAERMFNKIHNKLTALAEHKLIYHGARNEG